MRNLRVTITRKNFGSRVLLEGVSFDFAKPGLYLLTGPNGAGKSTFLSILAGQDNDYDGSLDLDGQVISKRLLPDYFERFVSFTPQDPVIFSDLSVLDNLLLPFAKKDKTKAIELLQNLGLGQQLHSVGADLSAGEKQRVAFGRALYADKPIVLLDEITANLDKGNRAVIEKAIMELSNSRIVIFVAHDCGAFASFPTLTHLQIKGGHMTVLSQGSANNDQTGFKDDKDLIKGSVWRFLFSKLREFKAHFLVSLLSFTACVALLSFGISYSASFDEGRENSFFSEDILMFCAIGTVGGFATPNYELSLTNKYIKVMMIFCMMFFNIYGFIVFNLVLWIALARIKTFGVSYLYPLYPFHGRELLRFFIRQPKHDETNT